MRISDIRNIKDLICEIKEFTNTMDYNTSSYINERIVKILPLLEEEEKRLENTDTTITSPKICIFTATQAINDADTVESYMNNKLRELVINGYKVIDYGRLDTIKDEDGKSEIYLFIKYTD